jgi:ribosomal protein S18 acetylase RimI-like enzyme
LKAGTTDHYEEAGILFREYAESLEFDLDFQDFDRELANLPGEYAPPDGCIMLAYAGENVAGCVALRKLEDGICEMKRLYVRPEFRGLGIGKVLSVKIIDEARAKGYKRMRLDTLASMNEAISIYRKLGFKTIPAYRFNPIGGALFFELPL